jgi:hypothetical protein
MFEATVLMFELLVDTVLILLLFELTVFIFDWLELTA